MATEPTEPDFDDTRLVAREPTDDTVLSARNTSDATVISTRHTSDDTVLSPGRTTGDEPALDETVLRGGRTRSPQAAATPASPGPGSAPIVYGIRTAPTPAPIARVDLASSLPEAELPASPQEIRATARARTRRRGRLLIVGMVGTTAIIAAGVIYCVTLLLGV